jgi:DNA-binding response OmpR family regulator
LIVTRQETWGFEQLTSTLITPGGNRVPLTANESILLRKLLGKPGENVPRSEIFAGLGQADDIYADRRLETMISRLRAKVRAIDPEFELPVRARHNLGYSFLADINKTVPRR